MPVTPPPELPSLTLSLAPFLQIRISLYSELNVRLQGFEDTLTLDEELSLLMAAKVSFHQTKVMQEKSCSLRIAGLAILLSMLSI